MVQVYQQIKHESGIPLGGIGAGTVEIRPDGLFHDWQMFNTGQWSPNSPCCGKEAVRVPPDSLVFIVRTKTADGSVTMRYLALREQLQDLYSFAWLKCVEGILFDGRFPVARLQYEDEALPVEIEAEVFSPFVPNDSRASGTPGFCIRFTVHNRLESPVEVSIIGCMNNNAGIGQPKREPTNRLVRSDRCVTVSLEAEGLDEAECTTGNMAISAVGGEVSYITGTLIGGRNIRFWQSRYGLKTYSYLHMVRDEGRLPNLSPEKAPALPSFNFDARKISMDERRQFFKECMQHPFFREKYDRIARVHPNLERDDQLLTEFVDDLIENLREIRGREWGEAALCSKLVVDPGAERDSLFAVGWYFPNHINYAKQKLGHMYEHWFTCAADVNEYLISNYESLRERTLMLPDMLYNSSLDEIAADAVSAQLSTLTKCTWWTKDGNFGVWEGLGCCGFHTTDITYQGSFPILALFPDLQKKQMTHGAKFQREDGRVHHFFIPDFNSVDNGFDRVDMNPQFVMLAARDYLWTGDRSYLEELWPHIVRAMDNSAELDGDGDGLPDHDTKRNTYDVWDFSGTPAYIASLWLGALKAAIRLAREMGDEERAAQWQEIYNRGVSSFESKLWNGKYYMLWKDEATGTQDECCMTDQMSGDWFCGIMGWGSICKPDRIRKALSNIVRHNFRPDHGLINASYPEGVPERLPTHGNMQAEATWTGIEYTVAAMLIQHGMAGEGLAIVSDIHHRHLQAGRFWNHVECGDHYYRALSSWTVMLALSGFRLDVPKGELAFSPAIKSESCEYPFFAPGVSGIYRQATGLRGSFAEVEITSGTLEVRQLSVCSPSGAGICRLNGEKIAAKVKVAGDKVTVEFGEPITLCEGDILSVTG